jgi:hypothetical protein
MLTFETPGRARYLRILATQQWARAVLTRARHLAGRRFILVEWIAELQNAEADVGEPAIKVGLPWLTTIRSEYGSGAAAFVLCHEIGHTVDPIPADYSTSFERELRADYLAGKMLAVMGFGLDQAIVFLKLEGDCTVCTTHPPAVMRIAAMKRGYHEMLLRKLLS